mmetsp:Transcript_88755/g.286817  ORF Transcript_88755/g.286817 Transcript_88755/m.286817 type:complete len:171 (-) Transcript_88755:214-726(-)
MPTHRFLQAFSGEASAPHGPPAEVKPALEALSRAAGRGSATAVRSSGTRAGGGSVLSAYAVLRGASLLDVAPVRGDLLDRLGGAVAWQPHGLDLRHSAAPLRSAPKSVHVSALVNWKRTGQVIGSVAETARKKYNSGMFVHWYHRNGFGPGDFEHAFETLETVVSDYNAA